MDLEIIKSDGTSFLLSDHDVFIDDFKVSASTMESEYGKVEGTHGRIDYGSTYGTRTITAPFHLRAADLLDYPLARDALFALVQDTRAYFVRELRRPKLLHYDFVDVKDSAVDQDGKRKFSSDSQNVYVGGKRYLVRLANDFDVEQTLENGEGELVFETTELPFAESIGTTQDIQQNGIFADSSLWGFGMGLIADDDALAYSRNVYGGEQFRVYNAGNVSVHPFDQELKISISEVTGSVSYLSLKNDTNGTEFKVLESVNNSQKIVLDGPVITSNALQYFRKTNKQYIELSPGWNYLTLAGAASAQVDFDFRFYYF